MNVLHISGNRVADVLKKNLINLRSFGTTQFSGLKRNDLWYVTGIENSFLLYLSEVINVNSIKVIL